MKEKVFIKKSAIFKDLEVLDLCDRCISQEDPFEVETHVSNSHHITHPYQNHSAQSSMWILCSINNLSPGAHIELPMLVDTLAGMSKTHSNRRNQRRASKPHPLLQYVS